MSSALAEANDVRGSVFGARMEGVDNGDVSIPAILAIVASEEGREREREQISPARHLPWKCCSPRPTDATRTRGSGATNRSKPNEIELDLEELRVVAGYAAACASRVLPIFERRVPGDARPREAIAAALAFSMGGERSNRLRANGLAAFRAAHATNAPAAVEAALAATQAVGAAFLHPLARAHQVQHILGAAAHAARAAELDAGDDPSVGAEHRDWAIRHAPGTVAAVLTRYPPAPAGGARTGELLGELDAALRRQEIEQTGSD